MSESELKAVWHLGTVFVEHKQFGVLEVGHYVTVGGHLYVGATSDGESVLYPASQCIIHPITFSD